MPFFGLSIWNTFLLLFLFAPHYSLASALLTTLLHPSAADPRKQGLFDHLERRARKSAIGRIDLQHDDVGLQSAGQRCVGALPRRSPDARTRYGVPPLDLFCFFMRELGTGFPP